MEHLKICCVSPHPPIMVTEVGGKEVSKVQGGVKALNLIADEIESVSPHTIIIMSPHSQILPDSFAIKTAPALGGSFAGFGAARVRYDTTPDLELARTIIGKASALGVPCEQVGGSGRDVRGAGELDHGILVPLYFLARKQYPLVCLSMSFLDLESHYRLGMATRDAVLEICRTGCCPALLRVTAPGRRISTARSSISYRVVSSRGCSTSMRTLLRTRGNAAFVL
jgi:aromatic ring-opening dioxygenase LigB subunit